MGDTLFDRLKVAELLVRAADEIGDVKVSTKENSLGRFGVKIKDILITDKLDLETSESVSDLIRDALILSRHVLVKRAHTVMAGILGDTEKEIPFPSGSILKPIKDSAFLLGKEDEGSLKEQIPVTIFTSGVAPDSIGE